MVRVLFSRYPAQVPFPVNCPWPLRGVRSFFCCFLKVHLQNLNKIFVLDITLPYGLSFVAESKDSGQVLSDARR